MRSLDYFAGATFMCLTLVLFVAWIGHDLRMRDVVAAGIGFLVGTLVADLTRHVLARWWSTRPSN
jgi:multisubunit Na+/H+ antiporter MnhE subunit